MLGFALVLLPLLKHGWKVTPDDRQTGKKGGIPLIKG
jgi:hypothetical protein